MQQDKEQAKRSERGRCCQGVGKAQLSCRSPLLLRCHLAKHLLTTEFLTDTLIEAVLLKEEPTLGINSIREIWIS